MFPIGIFSHGEMPDLSALAYEPWLRQVFDHPVRQESEEPWYWAEEWTLSVPVTLLKHVTRLCRDFSNATSSYSPEQVDQGIWFLLGVCTDLPRILTQSDLPWPPRQECIAAMPAVYTSYIAPLEAEVPMENGFYMWFELMGDAVGIMPDGVEKQRVADAVFQTLVEILAIKELRCELAALHGLGHLPHPRRAATVDHWLKLHSSTLDAAAIEWVEQCRDGTVM
jgi:hypothetical protein